MKYLLANWRELAPLAGLVVLAALALYSWLRRKPKDAGAIERERRAYVNRVGRIVEGQVMEIVDQPREPSDPKPAGLFRKRRPDRATNRFRKLLYYSYSISGVTYETAQDVTGLEEQLHLSRVAAGQTASVKYDPANPSNSILLADDWSGLR